MYNLYQRQSAGLPGGLQALPEDDGWQLLDSYTVPPAFEKAFGVGALVNPRATINDIAPLSFQPGDRIDLAVKYTPANDEDSQWQTVVVVKEGSTVLVQERQKHLSMSPGKITANCDTGKTMPTTNVYLTIEVWGHLDYLTGTWPY